MQAKVSTNGGNLQRVQDNATYTNQDQECQIYPLKLTVTNNHKDNTGASKPCPPPAVHSDCSTHTDPCKPLTHYHERKPADLLLAHRQRELDATPSCSAPCGCSDHCV